MNIKDVWSIIKVAVVVVVVVVVVMQCLCIIVYRYINDFNFFSTHTKTLS